MTGRQPARRAGALDNIELWMEQRNADVRRLGREAERAAHEALGHAARTGQQLVAPRPSDVRALGARIIEQRKPQSKAAAPPAGSSSSQIARRPTTSQPNARPPAPRPVVQGVRDQFLAGARGAQDAFTFGLGDRLYAGAQALDDAAHGADLSNAYGSRMAVERARDQYDARHYGTARTVGQVVGAGAQIAALGPLEGVVAGGARIAQATPLIAREFAVLGGVGGASGVGGQIVSDIARRRVGSVGDYVGAGVGGAVGGLASGGGRFGVLRWRGGRAGYAGALGGAATSVAQDLANLRAPSFDRAREAASVGGAFGVAGGLAGRAWSNGLPNAAKGKLGEDFSRLRTWARGDKSTRGPKSREYLQEGGWTVPDQRSYRGTMLRDIVESKFGRSARLSKRQLQASEQPLPNYRVDHTLPRDVGVVVGFPAAEYGFRSFDDGEPR